MSTVFISYMREDTASVDALASQLRQYGIDVWIDRSRLKPGDEWLSVIRENIRSGSHFIACFSQAYHNRHRNYMNEELVVAIEELRLRPGRNWFIPLAFDSCEIPNIDIGAGKSLSSLQHVRHHENQRRAVEDIISVIQPALSDDALSVPTRLLGTHRHEEALHVLSHLERSLSGILESTGPIRRARHRIYYNTACAESRLAQSSSDKTERETHLLSALSYFEKWLLNGTAGAWADLQTDPDVQTAFFCSDDDLLFLRQKQSSEISCLLRTILGKEVTIRGTPSGNNGGCVVAGTTIDTPGGPVAVELIRKGDRVISLDPEHAFEPLQVTIDRVRTSVSSLFKTINGELTATLDHPVYERAIGWVSVSSLQLGMQLMDGTGRWKSIITISDARTPCSCYVFSTDHYTHNYVAGGYLCHNEKV